MSRYRVQLVASVPLPYGARCEVTDTYPRLLETVEEARQIAEGALLEPPAAHTARVVDTATGDVVWQGGPNSR